MKLVLHNDNVSGKLNPCSSANSSETSAFARYSGTTYTTTFNSDSADNAYIGFMYGNVGSSDYASTHANTNKSTILTNLETWYKNNLTSYEDKLADTIWCNDKTNVTDTTYNPWNYSNITGLGYAKIVTYYGVTQRLVSISGNAGGTGPSLKCSGELSKITTKIGLLSADELAFSGSVLYYTYNRSTYLVENTIGTWWWTLSPAHFYNGNASVICSTSGYLSGRVVSTNSIGLRPAISLMSDVEISGGSGTSEDPYVVK